MCYSYGKIINKKKTDFAKENSLFLNPFRLDVALPEFASGKTDWSTLFHLFTSKPYRIKECQEMKQSVFKVYPMRNCSSRNNSILFGVDLINDYKYTM